MSELVKRLRDIAEFIRSGGVAFSTSNAANDYQEAADRIEELEAALQEHVDNCPVCRGDGLDYIQEYEGAEYKAFPCVACKEDRALLNKEKKE